MLFLDKKSSYFDQISQLKFVRKGTIEVIIGSGNALAPVRRQAITWFIDDSLHWRIYRVYATRFNELFT